MCRMLDKVENFKFIPGIYLPGKAGEPLVRKAEHFWKSYDENLAFIHPLKLNYELDGILNMALLRNRMLKYSDSISKC